MTSLEYYIEQIEQFISAFTDDIESGEGTVVTRTKLAVYREVLEHLEEIEQEPYKDAINREDALMCLTGEIKETDTIETIIARSVRRIRKLPSVTPQPKTGEWIGDAKTYYEELNKRGLGVDEYTPYFADDIACSECLAKYSMLDNETQFFKYCPNCGAKMVEPQESEGK